MKGVKRITRESLAKTPLPKPGRDADKDARGAVLVIGGSAHVPGAVLLAGIAALRAGAGKLQIATVSSASVALGVAVPEAMVIALPQTRQGEIAGMESATKLRPSVSKAGSILVGCGMTNEHAAHDILSTLVRTVTERTVVVVDAAAIVALKGTPSLLHSLAGRAILTPHAGEMASLLDVERSDIEDDPRGAAAMSAERFGAVVALKGPVTYVADPAGVLCCYKEGGEGLATSGSGDTLAGVVAGLSARGAGPVDAARWAVYVHGTAGRRLAKKIGPIGFLARELLDEIPRVLAE